MRVLMVYPEYPATFWSFKHVLKYVSKKAAYPPLGLLTVAAMLPSEWEMKVADLNVAGLRESDLQWADLVMVSAMLVQKASTDHVLEQCRRLGKKVIAGGPLFNGLASEYMGKADHLVLNEAEITLPEFLEDLRNGSARKVYTTGKFPSLENTPPPRWDLVNIRDYASMSLQYSRGCPHNCQFCDISVTLGRRPRVKSPAQFIGEMQALYNRGWRGSLFIVDDNFIGNKKAIKTLLPQVIRWMEEQDYPFSLFTEASIDLADDDELLRLMMDAGFNKVFIGLETPSEESLRGCSKTLNCRNDIPAQIRKLQAHGLQVMGGYIVGFDHDDEGIFARQMRFIQETGVVTAMVGLLNALPNTRLWNRLKEENRLAFDTAETTGNNTEANINFVPAMDRQKLIEGYRELVKAIYSPALYYERVCRFLECYRPARREKLQFRHVMAFLKSIIYNGLFGNGASQLYYWKMFWNTVLFRPRAFSVAMTMMIFGEHFRKVARKL
jgi:radical SAM superfamily enzyme YgiQ (UPF0313 family)